MNPEPNSHTAIYSGLYASIKLAKKNTIVIVFTDGDNNTGLNASFGSEIAKLAKEHQVFINLIVIQGDGMV